LNFMDIFPKILNTKFYENPASGNLLACGRTVRETAMMQLSSLFCNFAKAPKMANPSEQKSMIRQTLNSVRTSVNKHRQGFESAGCDALCRLSGSRGEEETSVTQTNCARLAVYTASIVVVLLGRRITDCPTFRRKS
jgi:hypothetical protein